MRIPSINPDPRPPPCQIHRGAGRALLAAATFVVVLVLLFPTSCYVGDCFGYPGCVEFNGCESLFGIRMSGETLYFVAPLAALFAGLAVAFVPRPTLLRRGRDDSL